MTTRNETPTVPVMHAEELFRVLSADPYPGAKMFMDCPYRVVLIVGGRELWNHCGTWVTSGMSLQALTCPGGTSAQVHADIRRMLDVCAAADGIIAKIAEAAESKYADQPERLIREVRLNRMHLTTYMEKLNRADHFEIAATDLLGLPKHSEQEAILKAIRDLKTTVEKPRPMFIGMDFGAAVRDMMLEVNIDNLLDAHKAPRRYEDGSLLTRQERIEWLGRRAPKP